MSDFFTYILHRFTYFSALDFVTLAGLVVFTIVEVSYYFHVLNRLPRYWHKVQSGKVTFREDQPPVSVVICARDEEANLFSYLPFILEQDYPEFEVIVVDDGSYDDTEGVLKRYMQVYPNLHTTFVPKDSHVISTKKLGLTLGIKAAHYDYVALIDADCRPVGRKWLASLMRNFTPGIDIVLGVGCYYRRRGTRLNKLIQYDTLTVAMQYVGRALLGHPYMGVGRNMAYRRDFFFENNGFQGSLDLPSGDDDLFVNRLGNAKNTRVEVSPESATWSPAKRTWADWRQQKIRHLAASDHYTNASRWRCGWEPVARLAFYLFFLAVLIIALLEGHWTIVLTALLLAIFRSTTLLSMVNQVSHMYGCGFFHWFAIKYDITLPIISLWLMLFAPKPKHSRYGGW